MDATRISDLPDMMNPHQQQRQQQQQKQNFQQTGIISMKSAGVGETQSVTNTYIPLNIHPNPYTGGGGGGGGGGEIIERPMYELKNNDVAMENESYIRDQQTIVNFIPPPPPPPQSAQSAHQQQQQTAPPIMMTNESLDHYMREYQKDEAVRYEQYMKDKKDRIKKETFVDKIQRPIFVALLFFLFQIPIWNLLLYKYISPYVFICNEQGEINIYGMMLKTIMFAFIIYGMDEIVENISF